MQTPEVLSEVLHFPAKFPSLMLMKSFLPSPYHAFLLFLSTSESNKLLFFSMFSRYGGGMEI